MNSSEFSTGDQYDFQPTPCWNEPGTLRQQYEIIDVYLDDPSRHIDRDAAWDAARALVLDHARKHWLATRSRDIERPPED
jgi:hypothetical protein